MAHESWLTAGVVTLVLSGPLCVPAFAQDPHAGHTMPAAGWTFMQDASVFVMFNDRGSPRGEREVKAPNWWMGMARKNIGTGRLTLNLMLSLDPATVGKQGYRHIFEIGAPHVGHDHDQG